MFSIKLFLFGGGRRKGLVRREKVENKKWRNKGEKGKEKGKKELCSLSLLLTRICFLLDGSIRLDGGDVLRLI